MSTFYPPCFIAYWLQVAALRILISVAIFIFTRLKKFETDKHFEILYKSSAVSFPLYYINSFNTKWVQVGGDPDYIQT